MAKDVQDVDLHALFIGDKAENAQDFEQQLMKLVESHMGWRENYQPEDMPAISDEDKESPRYIATREHIHEVLDELNTRMRRGSIPWMSAGRYWGQMNSETLAPAMLAYMYAMLWNSNNVALESSMATSQMEAEVSQDFCNLLSMPEGWGHITHDGSMANLEGIWYARCFKSIPLALKEVVPEVVEGKDEWALLNMSVDEILDICSKLTDEQLDAVKAASSRSGKNIQKLGKWIVPQTKHYSWEKALDIIGVGLDNMVQIPVDESYRMDIHALDETIAKLAAEHTPILGVVAVVGTTEEGAVDHVDQIIELRKKYMEQGVYFYLHVDAAYGAYGRAMFLDTDESVIPYEELDAKLKEHDVFHTPVTISRDVYNGYMAISEADSVTLDPHKMGYVPYSAGGIAIRKKAMRNIISYFAPYVFEKSEQLPDMLGAFIIGGSKAGANAAAVWAAHRVVPLNISGYGRLVGASIEAAQRFRKFLSSLKFNIDGTEIETYVLDNPDFNMVDWTFKVKGCNDLAKTNALNEELFNKTSYLDGEVYEEPVITSHTTFDHEGYGDSPLPFVKSMGMDESEWKKNGSVTLLRAAIMTPYLTSDKMFDYYAEATRKAFESKLTEMMRSENAAQYGKTDSSVTTAA
ncbi:decarboxylase [Bifidobacterium dolichotidis]|uniref:Decarboxylase n=1 Tax=Bifidobacterium dolichotidis TaxID=2306976 RepID=A0A430FQC2_9BIFI|nr:tyrosine decarboxylase [Bifidobacterium dolichotidis]RSX54994.1 decarboxylase [Bifidobacterium dolichotidis]